MGGKQRLYKTKVTEVKQIAANVYLLSFKRAFNFKAGQIIALDVEQDGIPRMYSIAGGEKDEIIDILFDEKPDAKLTPQLSALKPGDTIYVSEPFGNFQCSDDEAWRIASGTGVAPFVSMTRSGKAKGKILIHGGRFDETFYFSEVLERFFTPENYIRCASRQEDTTYFSGCLTTWLREQNKCPLNAKYYLCGSPEMVVEVRDLLISEGIASKNIVSETYF
ncbi:MAG: FAD-binding oxidoreductase [Paludibacteraceae bacterium]